MILHYAPTLILTFLAMIATRYYYNSETGITQWERPIELGQAPLATGRFNFIVSVYDYIKESQII